jgi:hypothetical protein
MQRLADRLPSPVSVLRVALAVFVLVWIFGPYALRSAVPIWLAFLIALGLELHFFVGASAGLRRVARTAGRRPSIGSATATQTTPTICSSSAREAKSSGSRTRARRTTS